MIYNGYLSLDERDVISDIKKSYADVERLNMLYEAAELDYRINCLYAESKVLDNYGTYDDLEELYTEASEQTSEKKLNILQKLIELIKSLFDRIKTFFTNKFRKEGDIEAPKDTENAIKTLTDLWNSLKGVVANPSIESVLAVKDTVINLIANHKKQFAAFNLAAGGTVGMVVWRAAKKNAAADKLLKTSNEVNSATNGVRAFIDSARGTIGDITTHLLQLGIDKLKNAISTNDAELEKIKSGDDTTKKGFVEKCRSAAIDVMQKVLTALEWLLRQLQKLMNLLAGRGFVEGDSSIKETKPAALPAGDTQKGLPGSTPATAQLPGRASYVPSDGTASSDDKKDDKKDDKTVIHAPTGKEAKPEKTRKSAFLGLPEKVKQKTEGKSEKASIAILRQEQQKYIDTVAELDKKVTEAPKNSPEKEKLKTELKETKKEMRKVNEVIKEINTGFVRNEETREKALDKAAKKDDTRLDIDDLQAKFDEFIKTASKGKVQQYEHAWHWYRNHLKKGNRITSKNYTTYEKKGNKAPKNWIRNLRDMGIKVESAAVFFIESGGLGDYLFESFMDSIVELYQEYVAIFGEDVDSDYLYESDNDIVDTDDVWDYIYSL